MQVFCFLFFSVHGHLKQWAFSMGLVTVSQMFYICLVASFFSKKVSKALKLRRDEALSFENMIVIMYS